MHLGEDSKRRASLQRAVMSVYGKDRQKDASWTPHTRDTAVVLRWAPIKLIGKWMCDDIKRQKEVKQQVFTNMSRWTRYWGHNISKAVYHYLVNTLGAEIQARGEWHCSKLSQIGNTYNHKMSEQIILYSYNGMKMNTAMKITKLIPHSRKHKFFKYWAKVTKYSINLFHIK